MRQRTLLTVAVAIMLLGSACSSDGNETGISSEAADAGTGAAADVEGVPSGCGAVFDVAVGPVDTATGNMTAERLETFEDSAEQARDNLEPESAAAARYFQLIVDLTGDLRKELESNPDITPEAAQALLATEMGERSVEFAELQVETIAFLDRRCGADLADPSAFGGSEANAQSDGGRPDDELAEDAVSMDDGTGQDGADSSADGDSDKDSDSDKDNEKAVAPVTPKWEAETDSEGATGTYWSLDLEVGEIWRTNKDPSEALTGTDVGTDQSWVMVEIRLINDRGGDTRVPDDAIRWLDKQGNLTAPVSVLTPQGNEWSLSFPLKSSERGYLVYPATVGPTKGASLQVVEQGAVPETIPLGLGTSSSPYPLSIATGQTGEANIAPTQCNSDVETDVREAQVALNATVSDRWQRPKEGQRFVIIDLGVTVTEAKGPLGCPGTVALFQLESRLELSNGDTVAPANKNFASVAEGATEVDQLVFAVADDVTSMTLKAAGGEVLAEWDDIATPQP